MSAISQTGRRDFLRRTALAWIGARCALSNPLEGASVRPPLRFVVANDLHCRDLRCAEWLGRVAQSIARLEPNPAFVVLAGDLSENGSREQFRMVRESFSELAMPVHAVIGNHDYAPGENRRNFEEAFPAPLNRRFEHGASQLLVLDTTEGSSVYRVRISSQTLRWVTETLQRIPREQPLIIFTHFPLGRNWLRPINAEALLDQLRTHNLIGVFSGHWHGWTRSYQEEATLTTGRCCSWWRGNHDRSEEKGYLVCDLSPTGLTERFVAVK